MNEPTTSRLFRNEDIDKTIVQKIKDNKIIGVSTSDGSSWDQPDPSYKTLPPFNEVIETESGHVLELDDTKDSERINLAHRTGTFIEMRPDGSQITRIVKDNYQIISGNNFVVVEGNCNVTINGNANIYVKGNSVEKIDGNADITVKGNSVEKVNGNATVGVDGNASLTIGGSSTTKVSGSMNIDCGGGFTVKASSVNLN
jgi:hypothetical protein